MIALRGWKYPLLLGQVAVALAIVAIPVFLIRPFSPQTPLMLDTAYLLRAWSPWITMGTLIGVSLLGVFLWRESRGVGSRGAVALAVALAGVAAWGSRQNHFEWLFAPLPNAGFVRAPAADFVKADDMVLAVSQWGEAVAYPVNQLAYHHLVEDAIGGVPIVATF